MVQYYNSKTENNKKQTNHLRRSEGERFMLAEWPSSSVKTFITYINKNFIKVYVSWTSLINQ